MIITAAHYLAARGHAVRLSVAGIFINRKNVILLLMCIELMLLAVNFNFIAFSRMLGDIDGPGLRVLHPDGRGGRSPPSDSRSWWCCSATRAASTSKSSTTLKG